MRHLVTPLMLSAAALATACSSPVVGYRTFEADPAAARAAARETAAFERAERAERRQERRERLMDEADAGNVSAIDKYMKRLEKHDAREPSSSWLGRRRRSPIRPFNKLQA